uniref:uncharacterized protein n=1 Tax=Myxine glutinosa TaxID=7769 RepID=UPI00358FEAD2
MARNAEGKTFKEAGTIKAMERERQASKLGNVPRLPANVSPLPANVKHLPANVSPLPANVSHLPANVSPLPAHVPLLPAHVPPLPAHVPLLPAHVPPLPGNHQPVPGNHQPVPGKAPLLLGHATPLQNQYAHGHTIEYTTKKTNKSTPESTSEVFIPVGEKRYKTIEGSFHQGHPQFLEDRGQQCVANCCVFVLFDRIKDASSWETPDLDIVLQTGNTLYRFIQSSLTIPHRFLLVSELPEVVKLFDRNFLLKRGESLVGLLNDSTNVAVDFPLLMPLNDALKTALEQYHSCFVNFALTTFAVLKKEHLFCVFDSHSRSSTGTPVCDGRSILMKYTSLQEVYEHCLRLAASMNIPENTQFEVTGMDAVVACEDTVDTVRRSAPNEIDDVSIVKIDSTQYSFHPLTTEVCTNLCAKLGLGKICPQYSSQTNGTATIGDPCKTKAIKMDGNCFFRALSYSISGTEEYHRKIRLAIVKHLFDHHTAFKSFLREGFSSVPQYIQSSRMKYVQTWATELEILAASDLLQTDIFTFSTRWLRYSGSQMHPNDFHSRGGIYLKHLHQNHYEIVECVKLSAESERRCTGINCGSPIPSLKFGTDMDKHEVLSGSEISLPCNSMDQMFTLGGKGKKLKGLRQTNQRKKFCQKQKRAKSKLSVTKPMRNPYVDNNLYRQTKKAYTQDRYKNDSNDKARRKAHSRLKYENDREYHETMKRASKTKYKHDEGHKELVKAYSKTKYKHDEGHKESVKAYSKRKYKHDEGHKESVKACSKTKYAKIECHREDVRARSVNKYKSSKVHRETLKQRNVEARCKKQTKNKEMTNIIANFKEKVSHGPNHICCVCHQRFFKNQVLTCRRESYEQKGLLVKAMSKKCITKTYFHECSTSCSEECPLKTTPLSKLWICFTGHRKILRGELPAEAVANNLHLEPIPEELQCLNSLEQHLTALHIPFAKLSGLPKGGQYGVHGPVVCVPSNIEKSTNVLPRAESDDQIIRVKLKRRISYKGHHLYKFVNSAHVKNALKFLVANNKWYSDVKFNKHWVNSLPNVVEENEDEINDMDRDDTLPDLTETEISENKTREPDLEDHGMYMDSCLQPVDIGQEVLDHHFDDILCIAPAEGNNPVKLLMDESNEAKSFPVLFPTGGPTYHDDREAKITIARYLHTRLMLADSRFAQNTDYIFYAQYLSEVYQVLSSVSIALRKSYLNAFAKGSKVTAQKLMDRNTLADMLKCDAGYKYLKPIRGTPAFWQASQKDLFAMLRQLGKPTWFCSFSAGDMRWTEIIEAILQEEGDPRNANDLDWSEKCIILKRNPITAARMFDHMFRSFLKDFIMSQAKPIGKIKDYFYRIEFQQRGSPHTHCLFWVEDAPTLDKDSDEEVVSFIDQYITCEMPLNDDELHEIVNAVQKHSSRHSKSCRKKGTVCRFHFPRPPSNTTFISRNDDVESQAIDKLHVQPDKKPNHMTKEEAKQVLMKIWNALQDTENNFDHANALFAHVGINQDLFQEAYEILNKKTDVVLQRNPKDVWVNQYNAHLLRCWNANMDIQYVADAYSCIVYIISYISKTEREMGLLLEHARKEAFNGNDDAKQALKKLGAIYLHNREVSAQEAVFRVCNLRLKESSRKVQFVPTGDNPIKMSLPFDVLKKRSKGKDLDADQIWMTSLPDRYQNRPDQELFDEMCLASFCSEFRVLSKSEVSNVMDVNRKSPIYTLQNGLGHIQRRTRTQPAVIRYPRFSPTKESEKYYQSLLQLFLPYRLESHLKPGQYETFQNFYQNGAVKCGKNEVEPVKYIVERNKAKFELDADSMDKAEEMFQKCGPLDDAWAQICPETEVERLSCLENQKGKTADPQEDIDIPDLLKEEKKSCSIEIRQSIVKKDEAENLLRCLNEKQREIFYAVREWCLNKRNGNEPKPFHLFVTGGAGTGKSHLIKTIQYEASRLLAPILPNPDDVSVLLTAPTGVAAFNINASTIHSTFSIGVGAKLPYQPLGDEKINSLRSKLSSLQIIIIDEISMVDQKLITYVHGRLRQIKQCRDFSPFGNVSVIAIGDFYQLSPVKGKSLYAENVGFNLWTDLFHIAELTQIMRQKDGEFAETLNRLRTRKKCDPLDDKDKDTLQKCETGEEPDCIHIYATNEEVDKHNLAKLASSCSNLVAINAEDFYRDPKSGKLQRKEGQYIKVFNTNLARRVTLAVGARVLLTKNIDVSDGLVNGVFGTVSHISQTPGSTFPQMVYVVFDNVKVGQKLRRHTAESLSLPVNSTPIAPQEDRVTNSGGIRRQFPVKLAFGCSIHKIQGCTLKEAVVSLEKIFTAGQAYVALSRVTSMEGLTIQNFKQSAIYCNENVAAAMDSMPSFITPTHTDSTHGKIEMPKAKRSKKQEPLKLWRERQASKLGNVPPLPANDPRLPANVSPLPANVSPLPAHVPLLPAHVPPLPAHVPLLPAHVPPLPGNHQPVPGNHQPVPGKAPLLLGHATPLQNQYAHGHTIEYTTKKTNKSTPESTSEVFIPVGEKRYKTIEGSFHQGHPQFLEDRGQQCVANCCVFVLFDKIKDASSWETPDLDIVLQTGNTLYRFIQSSLTIPHRFLLVSELPEVVKLFDRNFLLKRGESLVGLLNDSTNVAVDIPFLMPLNDALKTALEQYHSCFVNFALTTFAVLKKEHLFCVFDSHSRSSTGTPVCDGRSILMKYTSLQEVYEHCLRLAASMNIAENTQFEVTGMDAVVACEDTVDTVRRSAPNEIDDVSIVKIDSTQYSFHPLTTEVCTNLCAKLGLGKICPQYSSQTNGTATIGDPCKTKAIKMDGNCFFRALSYSISGTEEYHRKIRLAIVKHLFDHHTAFKSFLREGFSSVPQYIQSSQMKYVQTWATELEILAASDLLQTDIFTFSTRWLRYSGSQVHPNDFHSRGGIYLKHLHQNHYEIVECVKLSAESERRCTGINCGSPIPSLKFGTDMDKHEVLSGNEISLPCNSMDEMFTLGGKGKKRKGLRQTNQRKKFCQKQKRAKSKLSVTKPMRNPYVDNNLYRQKKKAYTKDRYENDSNCKARRIAHSRLK